MSGLRCSPSFSSRERPPSPTYIASRRTGMELSRRALASLWGRMFTTQSSDPAVVSSAGDAMPTVASPDERSQTQELTATATWWTLLLLLIPWQKPRPTEEWDASRGIGDWQSRLEQYNAWAAQAGTAGGEEDDSRTRTRAERRTIPTSLMPSLPRLRVGAQRRRGVRRRPVIACDSALMSELNLCDAASCMRSL